MWCKNKTDTCRCMRSMRHLGHREGQTDGLLDQQRKKERKKERTKERKKERKNEWINKWINKWMNEWNKYTYKALLGEWVNGYMKRHWEA